MHSVTSIRQIILVLVIFTATFLSGCAGNLTRLSSNTPYAAPHESCNSLCTVEMLLPSFDMTQMDITVALYGGILQARQPLWLVLTDEDQTKIREGAPQAVLYGFMDELIARGFKVKLVSTDETATPDSATGMVRIFGKLEEVRLNIFDHGMSGFGSAGDYSEAKVKLHSFHVRFQGVDYPIKLSKESFYAKTEGSLLAYTWSFGDLVRHVTESVAKIATMGQSSLVGREANSYLKIELPEMRIQEGKMSPVELAARLAAIDFIEALRIQLPQPK